jgi:hypothetical protein
MQMTCRTPSDPNQSGTLELPQTMLAPFTTSDHSPRSHPPIRTQKAQLRLT